MSPLFALEPGWNDFFTVAGFAVGVLGFGYTIYQVHRAGAAARAARRAAEQTLAESRDAFRRFLAGSAHRHLAEVRTAVEAEDWRLASIRANDLADSIGQMPTNEDDTAELARELRVFGLQFAAKHYSTGKQYPVRKWQALLPRIQGLLDRAQAPFPGRVEGQP